VLSHHDVEANLTGMVEAATWVLVLIGAIALLAAMGRRSRGPGSAAAGAVYDMLNEDKRNALEIIVEARAEARDPERADGNLPDLEKPI
jgi:hypothetical protein